MITTFFEEELGFKKKDKDYYKELDNSYIFLNLQKSRFANDYFINIGIVYKGLVDTKKVSFQNRHIEMRYRQVCWYLNCHESIDSNLGLLEGDNLNRFKSTMIEKVKPFLFKFDDLEYMRKIFPDKIPVLESEEEDIDFVEFIFFNRHNDKLLQFFKG